MSSDLTKQEKKALKHQNKAAKHEDKAARKQEKKMRKEMKKDKHLKDKHLHDTRGGVAPALVGSGLGAAPVVHTAATPVPVVPVVAPVAPVAPVLAERVVHEPERVIQHQPLHETEIINEHPVEVKREHHIQPVIHETEHRIQPIIKTEATTETSYIVQDKNVMLPPIVEPPHMVGAVAAAPSIAPATNTLPATAPFPTASRSAALPVGAYDESLHHHHGHKADKMVHHHDEKHLHEHHHHADKKHLHKHGNTHLDDRQLYHQDMMMRRGGYYPGAAWNQHHYNQYPNMMMMRGAPYWGPQQHHQMMMMPGYNRGVYGPNGRLMHTEDAIHGSMIAPLAAGETVIPIEGAHTSRGLKDKLHLGSSHSHSRHEGEVMPTTASTAAAPGLLPGTETSSLQNKAGFGQKIKGAIKEVQGVVTRNPAKKEEGRMIMQGADPASGAVSSAPTATTAI